MNSSRLPILIARGKTGVKRNARDTASPVLGRKQAYNALISISKGASRIPCSCCWDHRQLLHCCAKIISCWAQKTLRRSHQNNRQEPHTIQSAAPYRFSRPNVVPLHMQTHPFRLHVSNDFYMCGSLPEEGLCSQITLPPHKRKTLPETPLVGFETGD